VSYLRLFTNSRHTNPLCRVTPREFVKEVQEFDYDKEKYREMLLEAAETVLGYFGFDRTVYGYAPKKNRKWWYDLAEEKVNDRENRENIDSFGIGI
jgi:hypothetical protein